MYFKKKINKNGCFEKDQESINGWTFQPWDGDSYDIANREIIPVDTYSDYQVTGTICKGESRKIKIIKVSKVHEEFIPEYNTIY